MISGKDYKTYPVFKQIDDLCGLSVRERNCLKRAVGAGLFENFEELNRLAIEEELSVIKGIGPLAESNILAALQSAAASSA
jgi:hypothetical protein